MSNLICVVFYCRVVSYLTFPPTAESLKVLWLRPSGTLRERCQVRAGGDFQAKGFKWRFQVIKVPRKSEDPSEGSNERIHVKGSKRKLPSDRFRVKWYQVKTFERFQVKNFHVKVSRAFKSRVGFQVMGSKWRVSSQFRGARCVCVAPSECKKRRWLRGSVNYRGFHMGLCLFVTNSK